MKNTSLTPIEKEMLDFDSSSLEAHSKKAHSSIAKAASAADVRTEICGVWTKSENSW